MPKVIRSHTRKLALCYIYMKIFGLSYNQLNKPIDARNRDFGDDDKDFLSSIISTQDIDTTNRFQYDFDDVQWDIDFIAHGLKIENGVIDKVFLSKIMDWFEDWYASIDKELWSFFTQFGYGDMDMIKQSLFLLAYIEHKYVWTNIPIIINETVELAKLFWSPDIYKVINGVLHNYFNNKQDL